ncbi:MAG: SMC-Scp complex subunit ScpB [Phycisphaerales bacterium]|nr:SMC-Scp complex subunit ScpB [Phycisphaerales bacterium]
MEEVIEKNDTVDDTGDAVLGSQDDLADGVVEDDAVIENDAGEDVVSGDAPARPADAAVEISTESVVEAILFATDAPLSAKKIAQILGVGDARDVKNHIAALNERYAKTGRAFRIEEIAKGYQMLTLPAYNNWLKQVLRIREETKLSGAALETLAIVAYKQPILRVDVEVIRGVACGEMINRLREMNLVKIVGRAEEIGRPMLYGTTKHFLEVFGLGSLEDLPKSEELAPPATKE